MLKKNTRLRKLYLKLEAQLLDVKELKKDLVAEIRARDKVVTEQKAENAEVSQTSLPLRLPCTFQTDAGKGLLS